MLLFVFFFLIIINYIKQVYYHKNFNNTVDNLADLEFKELADDKFASEKQNFQKLLNDTLN